MVMMYVQRFCTSLVLDKTETGAIFCFAISYETYSVQTLYGQWNSSIGYRVRGRSKKGEGEGEKSGKGKGRGSACYKSGYFFIPPTNFPTKSDNVNCQYVTNHKRGVSQRGQNFTHVTFFLCFLSMGNTRYFLYQEIVKLRRFFEIIS